MHYTLLANFRVVKQSYVDIW